MPLLLVLSLGACASEEPPPPPPPPPAPPRLYVGSSGQAPAPSESERRRAGTMLFTVKDADLSSDVLPLFQQQANVAITWIGEPRKISLRLTQPMPWEDALDLVCQFTKTHPARDYQGRLVLKDGWGGTLGSGEMADIDPSARRRPGRYGASGGGGAPASSGGTAASSGGGASTSSSPSSQGSAYSGGADAARILKGLDGRVNAGNQ
jgi:hypothetical protein